MVRHALNNKGFTLIELLIAIVIISISMLALATAITVSMKTNLDNDLRNTAVLLTNETAEALIALPSDNALWAIGSHTRAAGDSTQRDLGFPEPVQQIRGGQHTFNIGWSVTQQGGVKQAVISVTYKNPKGEEFSNESVVTK